MHELSVAHALVAAATDALPADAVGVREVHLRLGRLSGVVRGSLEFAYDVAVAGTLLQGSVLVVHEVPVTVFCTSCDDVVELASVTSFVCPRCGRPSGDLRGGREIELVQLVVDEAPADADGDSVGRLGTAGAVPA